MRYLLPGIILAVALVVDSSVYAPYHTPKNFTLLILVPVIATGWWLRHTMLNREFALSISVLEILVLLRLAWVVVTNPSLPLHPSDIGFWILASLTVLTILARQSTQVSSSTPRSPRFPGSALVLFFRGIWLTGFIQALIGLWQWRAFEPPVPQFVKTWVIGTIGPANGYGAFLAIALVAVLADAATQSTRVRKGVLLSVALVIASALLLNGSRGAVLGLLGAGSIVSILYLFRSVRHPSSVFTEGQSSKATSFVSVLLRRRWAVFAVMLLMGAGAIGLAFGLYMVNPASSSGRLMVWEISAPMIADHPLRGVGQGRFAVEYLDYQAQYFAEGAHSNNAHKAANLKQAHNEFLQAFCESGVIGGLLFLLIWAEALWLLLRFLWRTGPLPKALHYGLAAVMLVVVIHALVDATLHVLPVVVVAYIGLGFIPATSHPLPIRSRPVHWGVLVLLLLSMAFALHKSWKQYPAYWSWQKGVEHAGEHRWSWAIEAYEVALDRLPDKGELEFHLGSAMTMSGAYW